MNIITKPCVLCSVCTKQSQIDLFQFVRVFKPAWFVCGENVNVWCYMMELHGHQNCIIVGSSTHNERIERLWRDVHRSALVVFADLFRKLDDKGNMDTLNEVDMFVLHTIFLPRINDSLSAFSASWNNHAISTERMQTLSSYFIQHCTC